MEEGERGVAINTASVAAYDGPDRAGGLFVLQGRHRRAHAAGRARTRAVRHPRLRDRAGHLPHADADGAARGGAEEPRRGGAVPAGARQAASSTRRSRATSSRTAISTARSSASTARCAWRRSDRAAVIPERALRASGIARRRRCPDPSPENGERVERSEAGEGPLHFVARSPTRSRFAASPPPPRPGEGSKPRRCARPE